MTSLPVKPLAKGMIFAAICSIFTSLVLALLLYFELIGAGLASKVLYGAFVVILFVASFIIAKIVGKKGLIVGLGIGGAIVALGAMYRFIGIETGVGLTFAIRSAITLVVSVMGAVIGVNTVK